MKLRKLLKFQFVFFIFAIIYLIISYLNTSQGGVALSAANPITSGILLCVYALFLLTGVFKIHILYRILMGISVVGFGYGGVIYNILNFLQNGLDSYSSLAACMGYCCCYQCLWCNL